jgi:hypothetical protein
MDYTDYVCNALGLKRAKHPLDGGTHRTRATETDMSLDELVEILRPLNYSSILEIDRTVCKNAETMETCAFWKIRGVFK